MKEGTRASLAVYILGLVFVLGIPSEADAYIGPGAGFAFVSSFLAFVAAFVLAVVVLATAPVRWVVATFRRRRLRGWSRCDRVIVVGLDGMSPEIAERLMSEGRLPNFGRLAKAGSFCRLRTTIPAASPVAWSTFQTGANPGKHNIFDFLTRDKSSYLPALSSVRISESKPRIQLGNYVLRRGRPTISLLRKSRAFWTILGDHGIPSIVLRVPITFPPEKFRGILLAGMCAPDLRGTQGSFTYFTTEEQETANAVEGLRISVERRGDCIESVIPGPPDPRFADRRPMAVPFRIKIDEQGNAVRLGLPHGAVTLEPRKVSPWMRLAFRGGLRSRVTGICRFYLAEVSPHFKLYVTPIHIDPDRPALPLSHPFVYASYLAKVFGLYATLGLAEDTWALNQGVIDRDTFLDFALSIHEEREWMFFDALAKTDFGVVVCVFDIVDRVQHTFWPLDAHAGSADNPARDSEKRRTIEAVYTRMDAMLGRLLSKLKKGDVLIVLSDHGFGAFQRGVNLNAWLKENGFLVMKDGVKGSEGYLRDVDWSRTKAYAVGLSGVYVNQFGREALGTVAAGAETQVVKQAVATGLTQLRDTERGAAPIRRVFDAREVYSGPYVENAPDLIIGFAEGYRVSWDSVVGKFDGAVIEDNEKAWCGDHCFDPALVPGVLFCDRAIACAQPGMEDIAPSILDLFGIAAPPHMDGRSLFHDRKPAAGATAKETTTDAA